MLGVPSSASRAAAAGLRSGDRVEAVAGLEVEDWKSFELAYVQHEDEVTLRVVRGEESLELQAPAVGGREAAGAGPLGSMLDVGGHSLRLSVSGSGPPNFLCLHGLVDRLEIWDRIAGPLSERGRFARVDQRGHGESQAPAGPCRREDLAADVCAVMRALDAPNHVLVGHSMGGIVAMSAALAEPARVAGLVLVGTASQCNAKIAAWYERIAVAGEEGGLEGLARAIYGERSRKHIEGDARGIGAKICQ